MTAAAPLPSPRPGPALPPPCLPGAGAQRIGYAVVVIVSLLAFAVQPGPAEAPAHGAALLGLADWAAGGAADAVVDAAAPPGVQVDVPR